MKSREVKSENITFIARGQFTPLNFNPESLFKPQKLFRESEFESQKIEIIHNDIAKYSIGGIHFQALSNHLQIAALDPRNFEKLKDKIVSAFTILDRAPINMFGINYNYVFSCENEEKWHELGHTLAPKDFWSPIMKQPGMFSLTMEDRVNPFTDNGFIRVKVEPDRNVKNGVKVQINNHFAIANQTQPEQAQELIDTCSKAWIEVGKYSRAFLEKLISFDQSGTRA